MKRIRLHNNIKEALARLGSEVEISNQNSHYDINIHSEYLLIPLLNLVFNYKLVNANQIKKNFPAVDLVDTDNRVAFQITSSITKKKVSDTLESFIKNNLHIEYDDLYILFLSTKNSKINLDGIDKIIGEKLRFTENNLINLSAIVERIQPLPLARIEQIETFLTEEFREEKISQRVSKTDQKSNETEPYYVNLIEVQFPDLIYIADIDFDKKETRKSIKRKIASDRDIVKKAINDLSAGNYCEDWEISSDQIVSFRDLGNDPCLSPIVDHGTITPLTPDEYCASEPKLRIFKSLLNFTFKERVKTINIQWFHKDKIYRFKSPTLIKETKITWTMNKKAQPRAVIKEIWNKSKTHIVCFRHLAFYLSIHEFEGKWYFSFNPTYSFTSNDYRKSRFSKYYASGKKKNDDNQSVYHDYRFILWSLKKLDGSDLFSTSFPYEFNFGSPIEIESNYALDDMKWNPEIKKEKNSGITTNLFK